jgi:hypothetical protein
MEGMLPSDSVLTALTGSYPGKSPEEGETVTCDFCGCMGIFGKGIEKVECYDPFGWRLTRYECCSVWTCLGKRKDSLRKMINKFLTTIDYLEFKLADCFCQDCGQAQKLLLRKEHYADIKIAGNRAPIRCCRCVRMKQAGEK